MLMFTRWSVQQKKKTHKSLIGFGFNVLWRMTGWLDCSPQRHPVQHQTLQKKKRRPFSIWNFQFPVLIFQRSLMWWLVRLYIVWLDKPNIRHSTHPLRGVQISLQLFEAKLLPLPLKQPSISQKRNAGVPKRVAVPIPYPVWILNSFTRQNILQ